MKKFIPILSILGVSALLYSGCNNTVADIGKDTLQENLNVFTSQLNEYSNVNEDKIERTLLNKYNLSFSTPDNTILTASDNQENGIMTLPYYEDEKDIPPISLYNNESNLEKKIDADSTNSSQENSLDNENINISDDTLNDTNNDNKNIVENNESNDNLVTDKNNDNDTELTDETDDEETNNDEQDEDSITDKETLESISTLYSLSSDIDESCEEFCELKEEITSAIVETQNLINKLNNNEIELTPEQRIFISEQSSQLKNLGRQLSTITTELNISLSDISNIMKNSGNQIDALNLKYLIVLDNLINGNEMLQNGLNSLYMMNQIFNSNNIIPPNNTGRILYGFKRNDETPIIKDYLIDKDGNISENTDNANNPTNTTENADNETLSNVDNYLPNISKSNIDTFYNSNEKNIDSFFNTAWLNNMNRGMYNAPYANGYNNPYNELPMGQPNYYHDNPNARTNENTTNGVDTDNNTQDIENNKKLEKKKFKFYISKNIDTYKTGDAPTLSAKFKDFKNSFAKFFKKLRPETGVENPIYNINNDDKMHDNIDSAKN